MSAPRPTSAAARVIFVDQARTLAITLMLVGHSLDRFLGEPWRSGDAYRNYQFVRGISSSLFLTVSGFSFVVATFGHWDDYLTLTPRLKGRIRRIGLIFLLGYVLHLWAPTLTLSLPLLTEDRWAKFTRYDVLQVIALGLTMLHVLAWIAHKKSHFWKVCLAAMVGILLLAGWSYRPTVDAMMPVELATALNMHHYSRFPAVPYLAFMLLGALFGYAFLKRRPRGDEWKVFAVAAVAALALIAFEQIIRRGVPGGVFPYSTPARMMPGNTFARMGCALAIISGLYLLGRSRQVLPRLSLILSKDALAVYFVHLLLVYGGSSYPSLFQTRQAGMAPHEVFIWIACLFTSMTFMAWAIGKLRAARPSLLTSIRHSLILGGLLGFTCWSHLTPLRIATSMAAGAAVIALNRYLRDRSTRVRDARRIVAESLPALRN